MSQITTHVLDTSRGCPAAGVAIELEAVSETGIEAVAKGNTNEDGRLTDLLGDERLSAGNYRLRFDTANYFADQQIESFFPSVSIDFTIGDPTQHYHVPLLLSPFGYSTYRGN